MTTKKSWARFAILGGLLAVSVVGARFGRLGGHAAGDDGSGFSCAAPEEVAATKGAPSAEVAPAVVAIPYVRLDRSERAPSQRTRMMLQLGSLGRSQRASHPLGETQGVAPAAQ